jgi:uncharacterized cofD-like protein
MPNRFRNHSLFNWLQPGMHVKRWLVLLIFGMAFLSLGASYLLREVYLSFTFHEAFYYITLQMIPQWIRGIIFLTVSLSIIGIAVWKLNTSLLYAFIRPGRGPSVVQSIYNKRVLGKGPRIAALGGGTGLSILLRGLKGHTSNLTAIVTVADDGGSTGRLRDEFGILAPGDIRQCVAALAESEPLMSKLFQYRFESGDGLEGHSFGNLFLVAMARVTGNFEEALRETSRVLNVRGTILPSTLEDITLSATTHDGVLVKGEHNISMNGTGVKELYLEPPDAEAHPDAIRAIMEAELVLIGPGSLYTSVLPNLLVPDIQKALRETEARVVFVTNVATEAGETDNFTVGDHVQAIEAHVGEGLIDAIVANNNIAVGFPEGVNSTPVDLTVDENFKHGNMYLCKADVVAIENRYCHDPLKLAAVIVDLYNGIQRFPVFSRNSKMG